MNIILKNNISFCYALKILVNHGRNRYANFEKIEEYSNMPSSTIRTIGLTLNIRVSFKNIFPYLIFLKV